MVTYESFIKLINEYKNYLDCFSFQFIKTSDLSVGEFYFKADELFVMIRFSNGKITIKTNINGDRKTILENPSLEKLLEFVDA